MKSILSKHAREQAFHRYGIIFTRKTYKAFFRALNSSKHSIPLDRSRLACYFGGTWYLLVYVNGQVSTFLPPDSLTVEDKHRLKNDERYRRIHMDTFQVGLPVKTDPSFMALETLDPPPGIPDSIPDVELPPDVSETIDRLLGKICDRLEND